MTDDYKDTLLRYFTGNLDEDNVTPAYYNFPQFQETTSSESTIYSYIYSNVGVGFTELGILQGYNSTYSVIYGNDSNNKGFIVILDETNTPVQFINEYSSGTAFGTFQILNVAEDGNFYGIDINNETPRFIMLNNIVLVLPNQESFSVKLRQSYNLPSPLSTATSYFGITKAVGQGKYLIGATYLSTEYNKKSPIVTELTINVGSANEWIDYKTDYEYWDFNGNSLWASWDNDNLDFSVSGYADVGTGINYIQLIPYETSTEKILIEYNVKEINISGYSEGYYNINSLLINKNNAYIGIYDGGEYGTDELNVIYYYNSTTGNLQIVDTFQKGTTLTLTGIDRKVQLKNINGNVFYMCKCYDQYSTINDLYIYYGIVIDDSGYKRGISTKVVADGTTWRYDFLVSNIYNLYTYNILSLDFDNNTSVGSNYSTKQIYNPNNYNGEPYENVNSLVASTGEVYDSNNRLIFARNLYNNVVTNNTTMSVLQIPNTLLNDITLSSQSLLSQTNKILTTNQEDLVKNIYETVYYNFYNTLMIEDRNTPIFKQNMTGAVRINNSTSLTTDYDNAKATKYRLNYSDNTNLVLPIQPTIQEEDSISGNNSLYITNAEEQENIIDYSVDGATEQDGTPIPDNPVEVETIPSIINLFDKENTSWYRNGNSAFSNTTNTSTSRIRTNSFLIKGGKSYTISGMPNGISLVAVRTYETNGGENLGNATLSGNTITLNSNVNYINIVFGGSNFTDSTNELMKNTNLMLEEGSIPHEYVPYGYWSKVKVTGKNLFNKDNANVLNAYFTASSTTITSGSSDRTIYIPCNPNTTYTISKKSSPNARAIGYTSTIPAIGNSVSGAINITANTTTGTITTGNDAKYLVLRLWNSGQDSGTTFDEMKATLQIEQNNQATPYEEYKENITLIDMSKENLFDINKTIAFSVRATGSVSNDVLTVTTSNTGATASYVTIQINNSDDLLGKTVTLSANMSTNGGVARMTLYGINSNGSPVNNRGTITSSGSITITLPNDYPENCVAWGIGFNSRYNSVGSVGSTATYSNVYLFEGDNPTPYYELCKIGDYKDTLSIDSSGNVVVNKNVGKVILNGSESWARSENTGTAAGTYRFYISRPANSRSSTSSLYSNYFTPTSSYISTDNCIYFGGSNIVISRVKSNDTYINEVNNFKTWLSTHNTDVYYVLATPETINLPNTKIPLFEGINHVTFVDTLNTNTSLTYDIPNVSTYSFSVLVPSDKTINSLDIISNDEVTTYHTIDTSSLENNKYYKITQNCHVEEG